MPSTTLGDDVEGFGIVFLEADLLGEPSVGTWSSGIPEAVIHGEAGLLVKEGGISQLADPLKKLLTEQETTQLRPHALSPSCSPLTPIHRRTLLEYPRYPLVGRPLPNQRLLLLGPLRDPRLHESLRPPPVSKLGDGHASLHVSLPCSSC